jgi:16S rRNA (cytosine967-C5)-methyltransferase
MHLSSRVLNVLATVLQAAESKPADAVLRSVLRSDEFRSEDKRLISRSVFTYFRWLRWLDALKPLRAQFEHAWELADTFAQNPKAISDRDLKERVLPEWVHEMMTVSPALLRELQREPRLWLRATPGQGNNLAQALGDARLHPVIPDALWYGGAEDLFQTAQFRNGDFEIQDLSSQIVSHLCSPQPGETWWDACAGEGGKTLHLCDLMQNKGTVWASDPAQWRLNILKRRAARARLFNYRLKPWTHEHQLPTKTKFDGILVDAPCSGIGTWGRNPHARWTTKPSSIRRMAEIQSQILTKIADSLKPSGKLIYSVCTLTDVETHEIAEIFEATHPNFTPEPAINPLASPEQSARFELLPQHLHANGMFIAIWRKAR